MFQGGLGWLCLKGAELVCLRGGWTGLSQRGMAWYVWEGLDCYVSERAGLACLRGS